MKTSVREPIVRFVVKHPWITAGALASVIGLVAGLVVVSGIVPVKASSGHWWITAKLLDFAKLQSVRTHSFRIHAPDLGAASLVIRGAGHYALGCEPCHGAPGVDVPPVMAAMTPPPPALTAESLGRWNAPQLFSIVKHGIKFTGMPGWPVQQRDDEVWAMVAFLGRMSRMNESEYRRLAYGGRGEPTPDDLSTPDTPQLVRDLCWRCHGSDGTGRGNGAAPSLAGQRAAYLHASLRAFADRTRFSGTMSEVASKLSDGAMRDMAAHFERLPPRAARRTADSASLRRGSIVATQGLPARDVPACVECHGPAATPKNPAYPTLAGQHAEYLVQQLELLKQRRRGGSPRVNLMHEVVERLDPADIRDVAQYYAAGAPAF